MKRTFAALLATLLVSFVPAGGSSCEEGCEETPLQIRSSNVQAKRLSVSILNTTAEVHTAYIRGTVQSGGEEIWFEGSVTAPPNAVTLFTATFEHPINVLSCLTICSSPIDGTTEGPDPIAVDFQRTPPGGHGGGSNP